MPGLFVTATGTEVGKTYVTAGLIRAARRAALAVDALKPVLTGYDEAEAATSDAGVLLDALGEEVSAAAVARIAPFRFAAPFSPNMAASAEGRPLDLAAVVAACAAPQPDRLTLVEGIGGVMVPLDSRHTVLDLIVALDLPVLLVAGTYLGSLSHSLTACAALRAAGCPPALIALNETGGATVPTAATQATLEAFCPDVPIVGIPRDAEDAVFDRLLARLLPLAS